MFTYQAADQGGFLEALAFTVRLENFTLLVRQNDCHPHVCLFSNCGRTSAHVCVLMHMLSVNGSGSLPTSIAYLCCSSKFSGAGVKVSSIRKYLRPSTVLGRKSTVANAFASALAPYDVYDAAAVSQAMRDLDQDPDADLACVYCGSEAATWDHVFNRVVKGDFSGHGHRIRNLVPCCRTCNESKGQKPWREFLEARNLPDQDARVTRLERFLGSADAQPLSTDSMKERAGEELARFLEIRAQVFELMTEADRLASAIRRKTTS